MSSPVARRFSRRPRPALQLAPLWSPSPSGRGVGVRAPAPTPQRHATRAINRFRARTPKCPAELHVDFRGALDRPSSWRCLEPLSLRERGWGEGARHPRRNGAPFAQSTASAQETPEYPAELHVGLHGAIHRPGRDDHRQPPKRRGVGVLSPVPARQSMAGVSFAHEAVLRCSAYSPSVSSEALPPAAVVLMVTVFSVVKRGR